MSRDRGDLRVKPLTADVAVVGAGPAGVAAAIGLARAGRDVIVLDRTSFPRDKYCGDGLTTEALRLLEHLGLDPAAVPSWHVARSLVIRSPSGREVTYPFPRDGQYAATAQRHELDAALVALARRAGVRVLDGCACEGVTLRSDRVVLATATAGSLHARYAVAADGMWSPVRRMLGLAPPSYRGDWHAFRQYYTGVGTSAGGGVGTSAESEIGTSAGSGAGGGVEGGAGSGAGSGIEGGVGTSAGAGAGTSAAAGAGGGVEGGIESGAGSGAGSGIGAQVARSLRVWFEPEILPGYVWMFPLPDGTANVGFGVSRSTHATGSLARLWTELRSRPHIAAVLGPDATPADRPRAWPIPTRLGELPLAERRVLFCGDAAGVGDPMTGEGIGQALLSGLLAAEALADAGPFDGDAAVAHYRSGVARHLLRDFRFTRGLGRALRSPLGCRAAVRISGATPYTRRNFARWLFEDYPRALLLTPDRWQRGALGGGAFGGRTAGPT